MTGANEKYITERYNFSATFILPGFNPYLLSYIYIYIYIYI